jgi:hypothetical protein
MDTHLSRDAPSVTAFLAAKRNQAALSIVSVCVASLSMTVANKVRQRIRDMSIWEVIRNKRMEAEGKPLATAENVQAGASGGVQVRKTRR